MIKLLIVADDLTGANDTGAQFAKQGILTLVTMDVDTDIPSLDPDLQVLVVDTESRHDSALEAAQKVEKIVSAARRNGVEYFYKKTDSTLRGNVGMELEAALRASGEDVLAFVPAYPKAGRFTRGGFQYVGRTLLHKTGFGSDPLEPITTSHIPDLLRRQTECALSSVSIDEIRSGRDLPFKKHGIIIFDCEHQGDLRRIGEQLTDRSMLRMTAGSAGFAEMLPDLLHFRRMVPKGIAATGPVLIVNGSLNEISIRQIAQAEKNGLSVVTLPSSLWEQPDLQVDDEWLMTVNRTAAHLRSGRDVALRTTAAVDLIHNRYHRHGIHGSAGNPCNTVAQRLGLLVSAILKQSGSNTCAVFGGDTLRGVMNAMSLAGIRPILEIAPGTVLSEVSEPSRHLYLVTKAGGFGGKKIVFQIIQFIRKGSI